MVGQTPARRHTHHASSEVVGGFSHTHGGHTGVKLGGGGQLDEQDVVVDGVGIVLRVLEHLEGRETVRGARRQQDHETQRRAGSVTHLTNVQHLDVLSVGVAVMFSEDHIVRSPDSTAATPLLNSPADSHHIGVFTTGLPDVAVGSSHHPVLVDERATTEVESRPILKEQPDV